MYRARLRAKHSDTNLSQIYQSPHCHSNFKDHMLRVQVSIGVAKWLGDIDTAADLSAGDATIINSLNIKTRYIGDLAPAYQINGPIEETILQIPEVDLFILSETIEHLDNPDEVLSMIYSKAKHILLSTPDGESGSGNKEHYWGWDTDCIGQMLKDANFEPMALTSIRLREYGYSYDYQVWLAKRSTAEKTSSSRGGK